MYIHSEKIISESFCAEGTTAVGGVVSLRPPQLGYCYTIIALVRGNMTICSPKADNFTLGLGQG